MVIKQLVGITSSQQALFADEMLVVLGITAAEAAGSASTAEFSVHHGAKSTDPLLLAPANFAADGFMYPTFFPHPIPCPNGVYLNVVSGTVTVVIYFDLE